MAPHNALVPQLHLRQRGGRLLAIVIASAALILVAAVLMPARAAAATVPAGGDFETVPSPWHATGGSQLLSSVNAGQISEGSGAGLNTFYRTMYSATAGALGTNLLGLAETETITSPSFTWNQPSPTALTMSLQERAPAIGALLSLFGPGINVSATLTNTTTNTTTSVLSSNLTAVSTTFGTITAPVSPSLLVNGDSYTLTVTESFDPTVNLGGNATVDLDNVGLIATPASPPAPVFSGTAIVNDITSSSAAAVATVDPGSSDTTVTVHYGPTTAYGFTATQTIPANSGPTQVTIPISGLSPSTDYDAEVVAHNTGGDSPVNAPNIAFQTLAAPPATAAPVIGSNVNVMPMERSATLQTTIDDGGNSPTTYFVQYGTTSSFGTTTSPQTLPATGTDPKTASVTLTGLTPGTPYYARFVADGPGGTTYGSPTTMFTTQALSPPTVSGTTFATDSNGVVTAEVALDPGSQDTQVSVSYGPTPSLGTTTAVQTVPGGSLSQSVPFSISGLTGGTQYYFQVNASSIDGSPTTNEVTYTPPATPPATSVSATSYTLDTAQHTATFGATVSSTTGGTYYLAYGPDDAHLSTSPPQTLAVNATTLMTTLANLPPGTSYVAHYVFTPTGAPAATDGQDVTFTTAPAPDFSGPVSTSTSGTTANINASVDPGNNVTTVTLYYGLTNGYGTTVSQTLPAGSGPQTVVFPPLTGLMPNTTYHMQIVASNAAGPVATPDETFMTGSDGTNTTTTATTTTTTPGTTTTTPGTTTTVAGTTTTIAGTTATSPGTTTTTPGTASTATTPGTTGTGGTTTGTTTGGGGTTSTTSTTPTTPTTPISGPTNTASCVAAYVSGSAMALKLLKVAAGSQVTAGHHLTIGIAARAGLKGKASYRIGTAKATKTGRSGAAIALSQLRIGAKLVVHFVVPRSKHRKALHLTVTVHALACGTTVTETHPSAKAAAVTLRSPVAARSATFTVPASWKSPTRLTVITATGTRTIAVHAKGAKLTLAAATGKAKGKGKGKLTLVRKGQAITVGGLPALTTGVTMRFPVSGKTTAPIAVRVVRVTGGALTVHTTAPTGSAK